MNTTEWRTSEGEVVFFCKKIWTSSWGRCGFPRTVVSDASFATSNHKIGNGRSLPSGVCCIRESSNNRCFFLLLPFSLCCPFSFVFCKRLRVLVLWSVTIQGREELCNEKRNTCSWTGVPVYMAEHWGWNRFPVEGGHRHAWGGRGFGMVPYQSNTELWSEERKKHTPMSGHHDDHWTCRTPLSQGSNRYLYIGMSFPRFSSECLIFSTWF